MTEIEKKILQIKSQDRRNRIIFTVIVAIILVSFLYIFYDLYNSQKMLNEKEGALEKIELDFKEEELLSNQFKEKNAAVDHFLKEIREKLDTLAPDSVNIDELKEELEDISRFDEETIIVRYYKRIADGETIVNAFDAIKDSNYYLHLRPVDRDNGTLKNNTIYYGKSVEKKYVYFLAAYLANKNIEIFDIKPFKGVKGYEWKQNAIEIGYEKTSTKALSKEKLEQLYNKEIEADNKRINIRMYAFNPDDSAKQGIIKLINDSGNYNLTVYPDWEVKPSFFSNSPTVLYYDQETKAQAQGLAKKLSEEIGRGNFSFKTARGAGYGVDSSEKENTFIIHYLKN